MFAKLLLLVMVTTVVGATLLGLRQQRLQLMHEMAGLHSQIDQARQATWDMQIRIAELAEAGALEQAIERAQLELEPVTPSDLEQPSTLAQPPRRVAEVNHGRR